MALDARELAATAEMEVLKGVKYIKGGILVVVLLRPPRFPGTPKIASAFPRKALMNLVTDLCDSRCPPLPAFYECMPCFSPPPRPLSFRGKGLGCREFFS